MPPQAFAAAHLAIILALLGGAALSIRRARTERPRPRRPGVRYRRVSSAQLLAQLDALDRAHDRERLTGRVRPAPMPPFR